MDIESYRESLNKSIQNIQSHSPGNIKLEQLAHECSVVDNIADIGPAMQAAGAGIRELPG